ncbi:outer membrane lipoprotein chaperone LolA [Psychrosphaera sp. B3R10]|uniref:Outer-membrane lipoprotein carrier protein n=1 Tax=Psychrosphaera algicola TaxID=3023714 RepID=A0ABT5F959_9GAMM|nr:MULTISPECIES: outer membrane lipoprotein chaperone LolA [unclassified Psychrosphaera]MBU2881328.1 outer membrane lipoprotein chaperone LolA [Psychrosphaera sp. I2R16]MBU2988427.1 outer membrane lipoprotein chaperone LolA [Psychrosphaera sp. B3R10]MDC2888059.1 outer membrane lipoprotein chaperone LolA [Psychrosphaera sp. G1-22]MDO6720073.1 outer membrane lipoprotein chaperone LolA [Psychrosphaera sp. 1_MG-2023]
MVKYLAVIKQCMVASVVLVSMAANSADVTKTAEVELRTILKQYNGFSADFSQRVVDSELNVLHEAQGRLKFKQPGLFLWEITEPEPELLVSNGETLWWFNPFIEQVSLFDASQAVAQTPFALLVSQDDETWSQFTIEKQQNHFVVSPKLLDQAQVIELKVTFKDTLLTNIAVVGRTMQVSQYAISNQVFADVDNGLFQFEIPLGTDIDDQRQLPKVVDGNVEY